MTSAGRARFRPIFLILATTSAVGALVAGALWWWLRTPPPPPLEAGWAATVFVIAGDGRTGTEDGPVDRARFEDPFGVAAAADGTIYVADGGDRPSIRRIDPSGQVSTLAGGRRGFADGAGSTARFDTPSGLAIDASGALLVADTGNHAIRRVTPDGQVTTVAGDGTPGYREGPATQARFSGPIGVAVQPSGQIVVADTYNDRIRVISPGGLVSTLAGSGTPGALDAVGVEAQFHTPAGVAVDGDATVYVADTGNGLVRRIDPSGTVTTPAPFSELVRPAAIAVSSDAHVFVADDRGRISEMSPAGDLRRVAGSASGFAGGTGADARFRRPSGLASLGPGRLVVADTGNALIRLVAATSQLELRPPSSPLIAPRFASETFALQPLLWPVDPMEGPHEIAGTLGEARGNGAERFHSGIDIREDQGTIVRAVRDGLITSPVSNGEFGSLNEWIRIGAVTYVHVRTGRSRGNDPLDSRRFVTTRDADGRVTAIRVRRGARFSTGDPIASVNAFNHVHLNVGWLGEEHNPLDFGLVQFADTVPPTIPRNGVQLFDESAQPLTARIRGRIAVAGRVRIVVEAWDQADGNRPNRRLGPYALGYQVLTADGLPVPGYEQPRETLRFDRLASSPDGPALVYAPGSGIPFYGGRMTRFLYIVTNTYAGGVATENYWDTARLPQGDYTVRVWAWDARGNGSSRDVLVTRVESLILYPSSRIPNP